MKAKLEVVGGKEVLLLLEVSEYIHAVVKCRLLPFSFLEVYKFLSFIPEISWCLLKAVSEEQGRHLTTKN